RIDYKRKIISFDEIYHLRRVGSKNRQRLEPANEPSEFLVILAGGDRPQRRSPPIERILRAGAVVVPVKSHQAIFEMKQGPRIDGQRLPKNSRSWHVGRRRLAMFNNQLVAIIAIGTGCVNFESLSRDALPTGQRINGEDIIRL